jgi:hypothetical protein
MGLVGNDPANGILDGHSLRFERGFSFRLGNIDSEAASHFLQQSTCRAVP